jgi:hypothetical protein
MPRFAAAFFFSCCWLAAIPPARAADPPKTPLPVVPATVDVVSFSLRTDEEDHKMVVTATPTLLRVDEPTDGYSIIYNPATQYYIGLENRNYTYWEFSWPEVKADVEASQRYETRLRDLGSEGFGDYTAPAPPPNPLEEPATVPATNAPDDSSADTNAPPDASAPGVSGYVWTPTGDKKRIADLDCVRWTGQSVSGSPIEAWCYAGLIPQVQTALDQVRAINEPIALVPVRTLVPPFVFEVERDLNKGGVTPVLIIWGDDQDKNRFEITGIKARSGDPRLFIVPRLYVKTTLVTMDGIGNQKPPGFHSAPADAFPRVPVPSVPGSGL